MARHNNVRRLDIIIEQLEKLHDDAQRLFDLHTEELRHECPGIPFGVLKTCELTGRAGSSLDYIAALKLLREKFTEQKK